jgi:trimeric autotransporter adhesin
VAASLSSVVDQVPNGLAFDAAGNLYIADQGNNVIRRVDTSGVITTVAGNGNSGYNGDGIPATKATLFQPAGIAVDGSGNIYIADTQNFRVRMVDTNGIISTLAGTGANGYSGDGGPASQALLHQPTGVAVDAAGNIYIADANNAAVRKIATNGIITTVAGGQVWLLRGMEDPPPRLVFLK